MESEKRQGTRSEREREGVLLDVGEVKSALARSLNAREIFWSEWLHFIRSSKLLELFTDFTVNTVVASLSMTHDRFLVSNFKPAARVQG